MPEGKSHEHRLNPAPSSTSVAADLIVLAPPRFGTISPVHETVFDVYASLQSITSFEFSQAFHLKKVLNS